MSDLFSVKGKVAVVTGGSRGIGLMIAHGLVDAGARVYISSRKAGVCDEVAAELSKNGQCYSIPADLGTLEGLDHLAGRLSEREQALHILVNNAGATWGAPIEEYPDEAFDKIWSVNVKAIFHLTVKCLPLLRKAAAADCDQRGQKNYEQDDQDCGYHAISLQSLLECFSSSLAASSFSSRLDRFSRPHAPRSVCPD